MSKLTVNRILIIGAGSVGVGAARYCRMAFENAEIVVAELAPEPGGLMLIDEVIGNVGVGFCKKKYQLKDLELLKAMAGDEDPHTRYFTDESPSPVLSSCDTRFFNAEGEQYDSALVSSGQDVLQLEFFPKVCRHYDLANFNFDKPTAAQLRLAEMSMHDLFVKKLPLPNCDIELPDLPEAIRTLNERNECDNAVDSKKQSLLFELLMLDAYGIGYYGSGKTFVCKNGGADIVRDIRPYLARINVELRTNCGAYLRNLHDRGVDFSDGTSDEFDIIISTAPPKSRGNLEEFRALQVGPAQFYNYELNPQYAATLKDADTYSPNGQTWMHLSDDNKLQYFVGGRAYWEAKTHGPFAWLDRIFPEFSKNVVRSGTYDFASDPRFGGTLGFPEPGRKAFSKIVNLRNLAQTMPVAIACEAGSRTPGYGEGGLDNAEHVVGIFANRAS